MQQAQETAGIAPISEWLERHAVHYEIHRHRISYTAADTARAEGVDPMTFAKVVGIRTNDGRTALVVLDATDDVLLHQLRLELGVEWVTLLDEKELAALAPAFEIGAIPPIPDLAGVPVYADEAVRSDPRISFAAGTHQASVRVDRAAWERAANIGYGQFATRRPTRL